MTSSAGTTDSGAGRTIDFDQLQIREQRLRSIVELAPACLGRVARDGTILAMNNAARSMLGAVQPRDVLKKSLFSFAIAEDQQRLREVIEQVCDGKPTSLEFSIAAASGGPRHIEMSAVALPPRADGPAAAVLTFREVTGRRRLEQSVIESIQADANKEAQATAAREAALRKELETERDELRRLLKDARGIGDELRAHELAYQQLEAERNELRRLLTESREQQNHAAATAAPVAPDAAPRLAEIEAECSRLAAERDALIAGASEARAEMRSLDERLRAQEAAMKALVAERDALHRAVERTSAQHATEMAVVFAERIALERRVHDAEATLQVQLDAANQERAILQAERDQLRAASEADRGDIARLSADRDAIAAKLAESQRYEQAARRWIVQWAELEQALHVARAEFQTLAAWARGQNERIAAQDLSATAPSAAAAEDEPASPKLGAAAASGGAPWT